MNFSSDQIELVVVEKNSVVRAGIRSMLFASKISLDYQGFDSLNDAFTRLSQRRRRVVIIDPIHEIDNLKTIIDLPRQFDLADFIAFSDFRDIHLPRNLLASGFSGIMLKSDALLSEAIEHVLLGQVYLSAELKIMLKSNAPVRPLLCTKQEKKIVSLCAMGYNSNEIAIFLNLEKQTVDSYRKNLLRKFNVRNVTELVDFLHKVGML